MLCDKCKKNEATIHVKKVMGGKIESMHLCASCAKENEEKGVLGAFGFNLAEVLFNIGETEKEAAVQFSSEEENSHSADLVCPACGWNMDKLRQFNGRVGCAQCYDTFSGIIADALDRIQRGQVHLGKRPGAADPLANAAALHLEIERNKKELAEFIRREEYEKAAVCRDKITDLTARLKNLKGTQDDEQ